MKFPWDREIDESKLGPHWFARMLSSLYFSTFMIRASFAIMLISFPIYIISLKSYFLFGIVLSSSPLFELLTVLGLGAYIDKHGRKSVLLLGLLVGSLALFALLLTKDPVPLFFINAFHGMSAAAILVASLALLADYAPPEQRGRAMGAFDFTNIFGWITGFGIGGVLIDVYHDDIGMTFVIAGVLGIIAWVWAAINVYEPHKEAHLGSEISFRVIAAVIKQRSVLLLIAPWFIIYLLISTMLTFTSKAGTQELGLSGLELGLILGGGGAIFLVTQVIYGHLSDKYGRTRIMIIGTAGIVGIMLTVGGVFLTAPASIAPSTGRIVTLGGPGSNTAVQSDFGVYLVEVENGTVLAEIAPPEGGFGKLYPSGLGNSSQVLSVLKEAVQILALPSGHVAWVHEAASPSFAMASDLDGDGSLEVFFADSNGAHFSGPDAVATPPTLPALGPDEHINDAVWTDASTLSLVLTSPAGTRFVAADASGSRSGPLPPGFEKLVKNPRGGVTPLAAVAGPDAIALIDPSTARVAELLPMTPGWSAVWAAAPEPQGMIVAYGPAGGFAVLFRNIAGSFESEAIFLPSGFSSVAWDWSGLDPPGAPASPSITRALYFGGYAPNGTLARVTIMVTTAFPLGPGRPTSEVSIGSTISTVVMVKRETAQSTFGQLTSPAIAIPLGIFALMAGAFGPAALAGLTDVSDKDKRGTTMGLYSVVISTSMIVGPVVTGFLVDNYGGFGVMMFLVLSAAAMGILMTLRAWDVRQSGGDQGITSTALREKRKSAGHRDEHELKEDEPAAPKHKEH